MINLDDFMPTETGVGCADHGDPACLCDVKLPAEPTPIRYSITDVMFGKTVIGQLDLSTPYDRADFADLYSHVVAMADAVAADPKGKALLEAIEEIRAADQAGTVVAASVAERKAAAILLAGGYNSLEVCELTGWSWKKLARTYSGQRDDGLAKLELFEVVRIEALIRKGEKYADIRREFGLTEHAVTAHARRMGIEKRSAAEPKLSAAALEYARQQHAEGLSWRQLAAAVAAEFGVTVDKSRLSRYGARHGWTRANSPASLAS